MGKKGKAFQIRMWNGRTLNQDTDGELELLLEEIDTLPFRCYCPCETKVERRRILSTRQRNQDLGLWRFPISCRKVVGKWSCVLERNNLQGIYIS